MDNPVTREEFDELKADVQMLKDNFSAVEEAMKEIDKSNSSEEKAARFAQMFENLKSVQSEWVSPLHKRRR